MHINIGIFDDKLRLTIKASSFTTVTKFILNLKTSVFTIIFFQIVRKLLLVIKENK